MKEYELIGNYTGYSVYRDDAGKEFYVLEGLSMNDVFEPPPLQQFIHEHLDVFLIGYWSLLIVTAGYLLSMHFFWPLYEHLRQKR